MLLQCSYPTSLRLFPVKRKRFLTAIGWKCHGRVFSSPEEGRSVPEDAMLAEQGCGKSLALVFFFLYHASALLRDRFAIKRETRSTASPRLGQPLTSPPNPPPFTEQIRARLKMQSALIPPACPGNEKRDGVGSRVCLCVCLFVSVCVCVIKGINRVNIMAENQHSFPPFFYPSCLPTE